MSQTAYEPRYASVKTKMAANRAVIPILTAADLGLDTACVGSNGRKPIVSAGDPGRSRKSRRAVAGT